VEPDALARVRHRVELGALYRRTFAAASMICNAWVAEKQSRCPGIYRANAGKNSVCSSPRMTYVCHWRILEAPSDAALPSAVSQVRVSRWFGAIGQE
jgi:hypothetical protein